MNEVIKLATGGYSVAGIAQKLNLSVEFVQSEIAKKGPRWLQLEPQAVKLRAEGKTYAEIAELLFCSVQTATRACWNAPKGS